MKRKRFKKSFETGFATKNETLIRERGEKMNQTKTNTSPASFNLEEILWKDFLKQRKEEKEENEDEPLS